MILRNSHAPEEVLLPGTPPRKLTVAVVGLLKVPIAFLSTCTALTSFVLARGEIVPDAVPPVAGIFLLACGAGALNNLQDRRLDARMERTRHRALPSGMMAIHTAAGVAVSLIIAGLSCLYANGWVEAALGVLGVLLYNGVYTPLKRMSWSAVFPGALVGVVSPAVGWIAGGRSLVDLQFLPVAFFFYAWQIPHFWLLARRYGGEYAEAGLASPTRMFSPGILEMLGVSWGTALGASTLSFPLFGLSRPGIAPAFLLLAIVFSLTLWTSVTRRARRTTPPVLLTNVFLFALMVLLCAERLFPA